jgi:REP element-mobilizing transposase RayT
MLRNAYEYRRRLPHYQKSDAPIFVTFCKGTTEPLPEAARSIILQHCPRGDGTRFRLHVAVVMPEHVHLLMTPLRDAQGDMFCLSETLRRIKGASARSVNQLLGRSGPIWQDESFDHVIRSDESLQQKIDYIRLNPVRRGLVTRPGEYAWLWPKE